MLSTFSCASWPYVYLPCRNVYLGLLPFFYNLFFLAVFWVFVSVRGLSPVAASRGHSSSRCAGLSLSWPRVAEHGLQTCRLSSSCGSRSQLLRGMWDLPRPGLEPMSPALAGRLSTTVPPGKPLSPFFLIGLFVSLILSCMSCLCILEINPLSVDSLANIFPYSEGCLFILFVVCCAKGFKFH